jgi:surfeit locus 1 family protein
MLASLRFKPALVPTAAALLGIVITALLGDWQLNRAAYKAELQARVNEAQRLPALPIGSAPVDAEAILYHNVTARGTFDAERTVYIDNRLHQGVAGYFIVSPLKIAGGERYLLVERGWIAAGRDRRQLPVVPTPAGEIELAGVAVPGNPRVFELSQQVSADKVWQNLTVDRYRNRFGLELQPVIVQQHSDAGDGLVRDWQIPSVGIDRHRGYALQWFSIALAILILYVVLNVRRNSAQA